MKCRATQIDTFNIYLSIGSKEIIGLRKCQKHSYVTHWQQISLTLLLTPYLYTFSLYENPSFTIVSAETAYISTISWYRNIN
jgi:hypothetical protein